MPAEKDSLQIWFDSNDGYSFLKECSRYILKDKRRNITSKEASMWDDNKNDDKIIEDLVSELYLFVLDNPKVYRKLTHHIIDGKGSSPVNALRSMYHNHLKDIKRTGQGDFFSYLYRKVQIVLARSDSLALVTGREGSYYAVAKNKDLPFVSQDIFQKCRVEEWPACPETGDAALKEDNLVACACFFWSLVKEFAGYEGFVPVREFVYYLIAKKNVFDQGAKFVSAIQIDSEGREVDLYEKYADEKSERGISVEMLQDLAGEIVAFWDEKQARAFYLRWEEDLSLAEIASEMGYSGPSGVSTLLNNAVYYLRERVSYWPGLYGEETSDAICKEFLEMIIKFCKIKISDRT